MGTLCSCRHLLQGAKYILILLQIEGYCRGCPYKFENLGVEYEVTNLLQLENLKSELSTADLVIDGIFGTKLKGKIEVCRLR